MKGFFECSVSYLEDGADKQTKKVFMVDAGTYTESEAHVTEFLINTEDIRNFVINNMKKVSFDDVVYKKEQEDYSWHEATIKIKAEADKEVPYKYLVADVNAENALAQLKEYLLDTDGSFRIVSIKEKQIDDIILFKQCCESCDTCESNIRVLSFEEQKSIDERFCEMDETRKEIMNVLGAFDMSLTKYKVKATRENLETYARDRVLSGRVIRSWIEDFVDEDSGQVVSIDRNETILDRGVLVQAPEIEVILESGVEFISLYR